MTEFPIPPNCPILPDARRLSDLTSDAARVIRRIRRNLILCNECNGQECPVLREYTHMIDQAIQEIVIEWDLAASITKL
jgi:hypothetical protein